MKEEFQLVGKLVKAIYTMKKDLTYIYYLYFLLHIIYYLLLFNTISITPSLLLIIALYIHYKLKIDQIAFIFMNFLISWILIGM